MNDQNTMKLLTNFSINQFLQLFKIAEDILTYRVHQDSMISPKTRLLLALCYCKHNEKWGMIGMNFGIDPSYAERVVMKVIGETSKIFFGQFVKWISVIDRITDNKIYCFIDATVQLISRPKHAQRAYYSGKHKIHCIKIQAFVSPTGQLIHCSKPVEGSMHDYALYKISGLEDLIKEENEKCQRVFGNNSVTLADAGYQGLMKRLPGAVTPHKRKKGKLLPHHQRAFNLRIARSRIIVENWFGRLKSLWAIMGSKFRLKNEDYEEFWYFCSSLTNFHISHYPLRDLERGVEITEQMLDPNEYEIEEEEEEEASDSLDEL